jgi:hypothetical protein
MSEAPLLDTLPGNPMRQSATLGHLLSDLTFFTQAKHKIQPNWFKDKKHSKIYQFLLNMTAETGVVPRVAELKAWKEFEPLDNAERVSLSSAIDKALHDAQQIRLEMIKPDLTTWLGSKLIQEAIVVATKLWNQNKFREAAAELENATKRFREAKFEEGDAVPFLEAATWLRELEEGADDALSTGLVLLDRALLDLSPKQELERKEAAAKGLPMPPDPGSLKKGDSTLLMASVNSGKTSCLTTISVYNALRARSVLFLSHEGNVEDIRLNFLKCAMRKTRNEIFDLYRTKEGLERINQKTQELQANLVYLPLHRPGLTVEDVYGIICRYQEDRIAQTSKGFDLLVCDYPAKLTTQVASKGNLSVRHIDAYTYGYLTQACLTHNFHGLFAIQTNREGSRLNSGQYDDKDGNRRLLQMEDASESFAPVMSATSVITLNRSPGAKLANRLTYYVAKSRSSATGTAVVAKTRFDCSVTHAEDLGAVSYVGTKTMETCIDQYLESFSGKALPADVVHKAKE